jgi:hypothetical protein
MFIDHVSLLTTTLLTTCTFPSYFSFNNFFSSSVLLVNECKAHSFSQKCRFITKDNVLRLAIPWLLGAKTSG